MSREKQIDKDELQQLVVTLSDCQHKYDKEVNKAIITKSPMPKENKYYAKYLMEQGYRKQKEGHWFILEYEYFTCSECGYYHPNGCDSTKEAKEKLADGKVPKYCSECGAKMKGE